jgi:hypothetical protein
MIRRVLSSAICFVIPPLLVAQQTVVSGTVLVPKNTKVEAMALETVSSETAKKGSSIRFAVVNDVIVDGVAVIHAGFPVTGIVTKVNRGVKFHRWAELRIHVKEVRIDSGPRFPLSPWQALGSEGAGGDLTWCIVFFVPCIALRTLGNDGWGEDGAPQPDAYSGQQAILRPCIIFDFWTQESIRVDKTEPPAAIANLPAPPAIGCREVRARSQIHEDPELDRLLFR